MNPDDLNVLITTIDKEFGNLNNIQLNWKPDEQTWSIAQVIEHLIVSNGRYLDPIKQATSDKYKPTLWEKINPLTNYTGKNMIKNLGETVQRKYVAPMLFRPSVGMISQDILERFRKMQNDLYTLFQSVQKTGTGNRVITSPVANLVTLKVRDAMELIIEHEKRHLKQALEIRNNKNFPA